MDGAVYEWQLRDFKRASENVLKLCSYTCAVCTPDSRLIYAVGTDLKLKEIAESNINRDFDTGAIINQIALSNSGRVLFAGTEAGTLRLYRFPLTGEYAEVRAHSAPVTRLRVSPDDAFVFSVAEDASFFVFDLRDKDGRSAQLVRESVAFAEETLVTRSDLEEKTQALSPRLTLAPPLSATLAPRPSPLGSRPSHLSSALSPPLSPLACGESSRLLARPPLCRRWRSSSRRWRS